MSILDRLIFIFAYWHPFSLMSLREWIAFGEIDLSTLFQSSESFKKRTLCFRNFSFFLYFPIKCKGAKKLKLSSGASKIRNKKSKKKDWKPGSGSWVCNCAYIDLHAFFGGSSFLSLKASFHVLTWSPFKHPHLDSCLVETLTNVLRSKFPIKQI